MPASIDRQAATGLLVAASVAVALGIACTCVGRDAGDAAEPVDRDVETGRVGKATETDAAADGVPVSSRRILCWGDSMTSGVGAGPATIEVGGTTYDASLKSYPEILQDMCDLPAENHGMPGATSDEIAMACSEEPSTGDAAGPGDILVIEMGSNGGWDGDYDMLIRQYRQAISASGCADYLVLGDTDDPGTSIGDEGQQAFEPGDPIRETEWEAALREAFGERFVNVRLCLIEDGLDVCGLETDEENGERAARGCIPERLRSDWTHLNSYGYYAKAKCVHERGTELGYW